MRKAYPQIHTDGHRYQKNICVYPCVFVDNKGFTLLELLVVLLILGLLSGLVTPRLMTLYDSFRYAHERDEVIAQLGGLGLTALRSGQSFTLSQYPPAEGDLTPPLTLPDNWRLRADPPLRYRNNGTCSGGTVTVTHEKQAFQVKLAAPFCHPERVE